MFSHKSKKIFFIKKKNINNFIEYPRIFWSAPIIFDKSYMYWTTPNYTFPIYFISIYVALVFILILGLFRNACVYITYVLHLDKSPNNFI